MATNQNTLFVIPGNALNSRPTHTIQEIQPSPFTLSAKDLATIEALKSLGVKRRWIGEMVHCTEETGISISEQLDEAMDCYSDLARAYIGSAQKERQAKQANSARRGKKARIHLVN